jgi:DNA modification methylase
VTALPRNTILPGDAASVLATLPAASVNCVVTSPPYAGGIRDYGGASGQLGQEPTVDGWVENLLAVFAEVARILKPSGSAWVNVSDTYSSRVSLGAPPKSMLAAPERLLLALMDDGWLYRSKIAWHKPNPMPESASDRFARRWEVVFHLTRGPRYFFDLDAVRVPHKSMGRIGKRRPAEAGRTYQGGNSGLGALKAAGQVGHRNGANPGDVWRIPTACFRGGHDAVFPGALVERPLNATCPERVCTACGAAWKRPTRIRTVRTERGMEGRREVGELVRCGCDAEALRGVVCDPFMGSGTTALVAERLGRDWLGVELNPVYRKLAQRRIGDARRQRQEAR